MLDNFRDETEHPHHMYMIGERCMYHAIPWMFLLEIIHKHQYLVCTFLCIVIDEGLERGTLSLIQKQFQLVALVINQSEVGLCVFFYHLIALAASILKELILVVHVVMLVHNTLQF